MWYSKMSITRNVMNKQSGFTLIEVMIVALLVAILASIALPSYNNYVSRSKIKAAQSDLMALSVNFENSYQRRLSYPSAKADTAALMAEFTGWAPTSEEFTFSSTTVDRYTLIATGNAGAVNGCVVNFSQTGVKTITACAALGANGSWL